MRTLATLFTGGGLFDVGAGLKHLWGVEYDPAIAGVAEANGLHVITAKVQEVDYGGLESPYWLHMSPPCINASTAKTDAGETEMDIELAQACIHAIKALQSPVVSLENVWGYRKFEAFKMICRVLREQGYGVGFWHLNAADYGVPQTRKRLFLVASRIAKPRKPVPTHQKRQEESGQLALFEPLPAWVGWYEAIEDLIPGLPDDEFAPWQVPLLPAEIRSMLVAQGKYDGKLITAGASEPSFTVTANSNQSSIRGVLVRCDNAKQEWGKGYRDGFDPAITATSKGMKAWVNNNSQGLTARGGDKPFITASATQGKRPVRAWSGGRVVRLTARAVARFQSVPDGYKLTGAKGLDFRIIGNGVPCLMARALVEANSQNSS